jgi:dCMP deaminase
VTRPSWDAVWLSVASVVAGRSICSRAQVGAVVVTSDNRIAALGYNGPPAGFDHAERPCTDWCPRAIAGDKGQSYQSCGTVHAETNTLLRADWTQIQGGTLYSSRSICQDCAKMICNSGVTRVVHIVTPDDVHRLPGDVEDYMREMGLHVTRVTVNEHGELVIPLV